MNPEDRDQLRQLAERATPGKRIADEMTVHNEYGAGRLVPGHEWDGFDATVGDGHMENDPAFLAATDPGTIIALLDELDAHEAALNGLGRAHRECHEQRDAAEARMQAVRDVHEESGPINRAGWTKCLHCSEKTKVPVLHPCPTIRALDT